MPEDMTAMDVGGVTTMREPLFKVSNHHTAACVASRLPSTGTQASNAGAKAFQP